MNPLHALQQLLHLGQHIQGGTGVPQGPALDRHMDSQVQGSRDVGEYNNQLQGGTQTPVAQFPNRHGDLSPLQGSMPAMPQNFQMQQPQAFHMQPFMKHPNFPTMFPVSPPSSAPLGQLPYNGGV